MSPFTWLRTLVFGLQKRSPTNQPKALEEVRAQAVLYEGTYTVSSDPSRSPYLDRQAVMLVEEDGVRRLRLYEGEGTREFRSLRVGSKQRARFVSRSASTNWSHFASLPDDYPLLFFLLLEEVH